MRILDLVRGVSEPAETVIQRFQIRAEDSAALGWRKTPRSQDGDGVLLPPLETVFDVVQEVERAVQDDAAIGQPAASWWQQRQNHSFRLAGQRAQILEVATIAEIDEFPFEIARTEIKFRIQLSGTEGCKQGRMRAEPESRGHCLTQVGRPSTWGGLAASNSRRPITGSGSCWRCVMVSALHPESGWDRGSPCPALTRVAYDRLCRSRAGNASKNQAAPVRRHRTEAPLLARQEILAAAPCRIEGIHDPGMRLAAPAADQSRLQRGRPSPVQPRAWPVGRGTGGGPAEGLLFWRASLVWTGRRTGRGP